MAVAILVLELAKKLQQVRSLAIGSDADMERCWLHPLSSCHLRYNFRRSKPVGTTLSFAHSIRQEKRGHVTPLKCTPVTRGCHSDRLCTNTHDLGQDTGQGSQAIFREVKGLSR